MMQFDSRWGWGAVHGGGFLWMLIAALVIVVPFWRLLPRLRHPELGGHYRRLSRWRPWCCFG